MNCHAALFFDILTYFQLRKDLHADVILIRGASLIDEPLADWDYLKWKYILGFQRNNGWALDYSSSNEIQRVVIKITFIFLHVDTQNGSIIGPQVRRFSLFERESSIPSK